MPVTTKAVSETERGSWFSHESEVATPYYYSVYLADHDVLTEITPTERAAVFRMTYPESETSALIVDAFQGGSSLEVLDGGKTIIGRSTYNNGGVPDNFANYFIITLDRAPKSYQLYDGDRMVTASSAEGAHMQLRLEFPTRKNETIEARVSSSFISSDQARRNILEVQDKTFDQVRDQAQTAWDDVLGRIRVQGGSTDQMRTFYSCLYRATLFPRKFYEIDGKGQAVHYSPYNGQVLPGYLYTDTGFWDTFRSLFPLLNLVYPSVNREIQAGLANVYRESGFLPEWASPGHRSCMVGNNSLSIVSDAILQGVTPKEDIQTLYEAMLATRKNVHPTVRSTGRLGYQYYDSLGYVPMDVGINESAARTLEYAYDDWCAAQVAGLLGKEADKEMLLKASGNYKNLFDSSSLLMRGREKDGTFEAQFSPYKWGGVFTEGNAWHYTWSVFHDVYGLASLMGGKNRFKEMLDSVFVVPPVYDDSYYGSRIHEITEMQVAHMGNYAHGNQPAQHMIYLYDWTDEPKKAQYWTREVMDRLYSARPDGYCGDEDNGQTSAWYVFSALGFYPVCPGSDAYAASAPLFKKAVISLENGEKVTISAPDNSSSNRYVRSLTLNGQKLDRPFLDCEALRGGCDIVFEMEP